MGRDQRKPRNQPLEFPRRAFQRLGGMPGTLDRLAVIHDPGRDQVADQLGVGVGLLGLLGQQRLIDLARRGANV